MEANQEERTYVENGKDSTAGVFNKIAIHLLLFVPQVGDEDEVADVTFERSSSEKEGSQRIRKISYDDACREN